VSRQRLQTSSRANTIIIFYEATPRIGTGTQRARGIPFSALKKIRFSMGTLAHAFYLLADLKGPIRPNFRAPCHFFIDPSIQPDSITRIQLSNLLFDLLGIHESSRLKRLELFNVPRDS
jgi:hypothetical protein